ncbi:thioredoxin domain-containing protein [Ancylomarina sp. DW003]|nr:thioredoxin domain-containing protein [Ancylomarina sp. DW003]MDE5422726.1 thioredoxin domain-containing protein [Ancylomarina sp. DW003]
MRKLFTLITALFLCSNLFSQGIEFEHGTFVEALAKAKKENKMVFMDCYTKWCGPCKKMAKNVFPQQEVGNYFNANFVNVKMDMESEAGELLKEKYQVTAYPTLLWLDADGNIQHRAAGASNEKALVKLGKQALDTENNFAALNKRYDNGDRDPEFIAKYVLAIVNAGVDAKDVTDSYFSGKKSEELINAKDFRLIISIARKSSHPMYHFVLENQEKFAAVTGEDKVDMYLGGTLYGELMSLEHSGDQDALEAKRKEVKKLGKIGTKVLENINLMKLGRDPDKSKFYQANLDYTSKYSFNKQQELVECVRSIAKAKEGITKEILEQALELSKRSIELKSSFLAIDTYAHLLYRLERGEEAKVQALKVMDLLNSEDFPERVRKNISKGLWSVKFLSEQE